MHTGGGARLDDTWVLTPLFLDKLDSLNIETILLDKMLYSEALVAKFTEPDSCANFVKVASEGQGRGVSCPNLCLPMIPNRR